MRLLPALAGMMLIAALAIPPAYAGSVLELQGKGVQIYTCAADRPVFTWQLKAPDAMLFDPQGRPIGRHFAGPTWQAVDGSTVVGEVLTSGSNAAGAVPWLVLRAESHTGDGVFSGVSYIIRNRTVGGAAPGTGCDKDHAGAEIRVDYTASYMFFP
ncbi:MAG: DUF3455 domain-containing protein [Janthinobacterium lividum]